MRLRERQQLYHALGQLLKSGVTFPTAARQLTNTARGTTRRFLATLSSRLERGETVGEAFAASHEASALDTHVIGAVERSGRLDRGFEQLAHYYGALADARAIVLQKSAYPIFIAHFGILLLNAPIVVTKGVSDYLREVGWTFGLVYAAACAVWLCYRPLTRLGEHSATVDRALTSVPLLGQVRRCFALARFCFVYDLQLDAGVNVIDAVLGAARASRSGRIAKAVEKIIPELRSGAAVGTSLGVSDAFPSQMLRELQVAESIGGLDRELPRMAREFQERAVRTLGLAAEWGAKLLYVGVLLFLGWRIISLYLGVIGEATRMLDM